jgi:predicted alpha/beta hydrolase family esterase
MTARIFVVHGYGGQQFHSTTAQRLQAHAHNIAPNELTVTNWHWNSGSLHRLSEQGAHWNQAKEDAEEAGSAFAKALSASQMPTYVVAHSLGTAVVLAALHQLKTVPSELHGCFFFGAAVPANTTFAFGVHETFFIWNYFSRDDKILQSAYAFTERAPAAGRVGFEVDPGRPYMTNLLTRRGHVDYLDLQRNSVDLIAYKQGRRSPTHATEKKKPTGGGKTHWDDVAYVGDKKVQRNLRGIRIIGFWGDPYRVIGATAPHLLYATARDFRAAYEYALSCRDPEPARSDG